MQQKDDKLIYPKLSYEVNGILFSVHNEMGRYCNEKQYADAVEKKLQDSGIDYEREKKIPISFPGEIEGRNKVDFMVGNKIVVEIKAKRIISREEYYQTMRYLRASGKKLAILVNFRDKYLRPKRILNSTVAE